MNDESDKTDKVGVLETTDPDGRVVRSSKRLFGSIMVSAGGALLLALGVVGIFRQIADPQTGLTAGQALIITGAGLLGFGVLDGIGKAIGGRGDK